jgi:hypothetical protein
MPSSDFDFRFPDLRILDVNALVPHERHDEQRMRPLARRIRENGVLKNPPIVAPMDPGPGGSQQFVVLDGANRSTAFLTAGIPHIVAQVVRYAEPDVRLTTWYHALGEFPHADIETACLRIPGLECHQDNAVHARALVARREALACVIHVDGAITTFHGGRDLQERNHLLNAIVDTYRDRQKFYRMSADSLEAARERYPEVTALVVFPHFEPAEVVELATNGGRMPAGITRHLIRWRALRLNVPVAQLASSDSLEAKNQWLARWLEERLTAREVRFYEEPTVLFDE